MARSTNQNLAKAKSFQFTNRQLEVFTTEADKLGITFSEVIRRVLDDAIEREKLEEK